MPKSAVVRKRIVGGCVEENNVVDPERKAAWLVLKDQRLDAERVKAVDFR